LLALRSPANIARLVVAVTVRETIQRMLRAWTWSHIGIESLESFPPTLAHPNASLTVPVVTDELRVVATRFDTCPSIMLGCMATSVRLCPFDKKLLVPAPAGLRLT